MKRIQSVLFISAISFFLASCQKEITLEDISRTNPGTGNNGGSTASSYFPLTTGSFWKLKDSATNVVSTLTVTNKKKTINNIPYTLVMSDNGTVQDSIYFAVNGPNYYFIAKKEAPSGGSIELFTHYLNDTASVGSSWDYAAGQGNGFGMYSTTTILEKGISITVKGKTYTDVIHTRVNLQYNIFGSIIDAADYDYYIAKGVGIVQIISDLDAMGVAYHTRTELIDYKIQ